MFKWIMPYLNIKPAERSLVKSLFIAQFLLGIATAFLYVSSITLFLHSFHEGNPLLYLPKAFILSAVLILLFNQVYAYIEKRYAPVKVLQLVTLFSGISVLAFCIGISIEESTFLLFVLAAWNVLIYMLVAYAFWGLAATLFNVRESRRLFSVVGAGDIPGKLLGYLAVYGLKHVINISSLLYISVAAFAIALYFIKNLSKQVQSVTVETHAGHEHVHTKAAGVTSFNKMIERLFQNKLIFSISLLAVLSSVVFSFFDFTFLSEIKLKFEDENEIARFIAIFFAAGRIMAILIKVLLSSQVIARLGLTNSLLITPVVLLVLNSIVAVSITSAQTHLFIFGFMVLLLEILRATVQDPVFLILFQPLTPHDRLKGHLIAKGYTMPVALLIVGIFLEIYQANYKVSIQFISQIILGILVLWTASVFLIKKEYMQTLLKSIRKGYFTGHDLFLNDQSVTNLLLGKTKSARPLEVIHALNLLQRSSYSQMTPLLLEQLEHSESQLVKEYVLDQVIGHTVTGALPIIEKELAINDNRPPYIKAYFYLSNKPPEDWIDQLQVLPNQNKKAALLGLWLRKDKAACTIVEQEVKRLAQSADMAQNRLANEIIAEAGSGDFTDALRLLLHHPSAPIYQKAVEAAGKAKQVDLLPELIQLTEDKKAYYAFQQALVQYGDDVFVDTYLAPSLLSVKALEYALKAAAKVKGKKSEGYLVSFLKNNEGKKETVIKALWLRKANLSGYQSEIEDWIGNQLEYMKTKIDYMLSLYNQPEAKMLEEALISELQQNVEVVLKASALIYERDRINRFIEVYNMNQSAKVANAMELLELTIPKKFFSSLNYCIELTQDVKSRQVMYTKNKSSIEVVVQDIISDTNAIFNSWTQSVALFIVPKMVGQRATVSMPDVVRDEDALLQETRNYVLSILK